MNGRRADGTHDSEVRRLGIGDRKMTNDPHDNWRENEFITGRRVSIDIYESERMKWEEKFIVRSSKKESKKWARGSVIEL